MRGDRERAGGERRGTISNSKEATIRGKATLGSSRMNDRDGEKLREEILQYWFLLEKELSGAIAKGNFKLLNLAKTRVDYLKPVIDKELLQKCIEGDEEALCSTRHFLINNGWWERANNVNFKDREFIKDDSRLIEFIMQKREFVHPNFIKMVEKEDEEGFRMALNQIHYGTLKVSRDTKESQRVVKTSYNDKQGAKVFGKVNRKENSKIENDFITNHAHLVDPWILKKTVKGIEFYINRALYQIHSRSLANSCKNEKLPKTLKQV